MASQAWFEKLSWDEVGSEPDSAQLGDLTRRIRSVLEAFSSVATGTGAGIESKSECVDGIGLTTLVQIEETRRRLDHLHSAAVGELALMLAELPETPSGLRMHSLVLARLTQLQTFAEASLNSLEAILEPIQQGGTGVRDVSEELVAVIEDEAIRRRLPALVSIRQRWPEVVPPAAGMAMMLATQAGLTAILDRCLVHLLSAELDSDQIDVRLKLSATTEVAVPPPAIEAPVLDRARRVVALAGGVLDIQQARLEIVLTISIPVRSPGLRLP